MQINEESKEAMKEILADIQSGQFARDWIKENKDGRPRMNRYRQEGQTRSGR